MKTCSRCQENKSLILFSKSKRGLFGVNSICKSCISKSDRERRLYNHEESLKKEREKYQSDPKKHSQKSIKSARKHREKTLARSRAFYKKNKDRLNQQRRSKDKQYPELKRVGRMKYEMSKIQATPDWLSTENWSEINSFYMNAVQLQKEDGIQRQVDHIIPLKGENICGLHVPWNLQLLTVSENCSKNNRFDGSYDNDSWCSLTYSKIA